MLSLPPLSEFATPRCPWEEAPGDCCHCMTCLPVRPPSPPSPQSNTISNWQLPQGLQSHRLPGNAYFLLLLQRAKLSLAFLVLGPFTTTCPPAPRSEGTVVTQHRQKGTCLIFPFSAPGQGPGWFLQKQWLIPQQLFHLWQKASSCLCVCGPVLHQVLNKCHLFSSSCPHDQLWLGKPCAVMGVLCTCSVQYHSH